MSPSFTVYEAGTSLDWDGDKKLCILPIKTLYLGIGGNEKADSAVTSSLELHRANVCVPYNEFKYCFSQYILSTWQGDRNGAVANKRYSVKPVLGKWQSSNRRCRKNEVFVCRARICHTHLTSSYILKKDLPPQCEHCQCILTVRYILVECNHLARVRRYIWKKRCGGII